MVGPPASLLSSFLTFIAIHTVYLYFLDWNFFCLILRCLQLLSIWKGVKEPQVQKFLFAIALFLNIPVFFLQWLFRNSHPVTIDFIGSSSDTTSSLLIVFWILVVLSLQLVVMLNSRIFLFSSSPAGGQQGAQQNSVLEELFDVGALV